MEQVNDAVTGTNVLKQNPNIDFNRIGIVGYSWGGLAGAILAGKIPGVNCLVSLEGSEFHHYGNAKDENADFDAIRNGEDFMNIHLSIPYLRLESSLQRSRIK
jgi:dienelactone hydrolase